MYKESSFDVIYSFNAFYCFPEQESTLKKLQKVAKESADLIIFDYASPESYTKSSIFYDSTGKATSSIFSPINLKTIESMLNRMGWHLDKLINLENQYIKWYETLVAKMTTQKDNLISRFGEVPYRDLLEGYRLLFDGLYQKELTGVIIHAKK